MSKVFDALHLFVILPQLFVLKKGQNSLGAPIRQ